MSLMAFFRAGDEAGPAGPAPGSEGAGAAAGRPARRAAAHGLDEVGQGRRRHVGGRGRARDRRRPHDGVLDRGQELREKIRGTPLAVDRAEVELRDALLDHEVRELAGMDEELRDSLVLPPQEEVARVLAAGKQDDPQVEAAPEQERDRPHGRLGAGLVAVVDENRRGPRNA